MNHTVRFLQGWDKAGQLIVGATCTCGWTMYDRDGRRVRELAAVHDLDEPTAPTRENKCRQL